jgi:hypothetical protein
VEELVLRAELLCSTTKFKENFMIIASNGFDTILNNIYLDVYCMNILKGGFKLRIIAKLVNKSINLDDAPPNSLKDSNVSFKMKTLKKKLEHVTL